MYNRHDQTLRRANRNTNIIEIFVDYIIPMNFGIDGWKFLKATDNCTYEKAHKAKTGAMLLFKIIFIFRA